VIENLAARRATRRYLPKPSPDLILIEIHVLQCRSPNLHYSREKNFLSSGFECRKDVFERGNVLNNFEIGGDNDEIEFVVC
jgi:hypothetical protein